MHISYDFHNKTFSFDLNSFKLGFKSSFTYVNIKNIMFSSARDLEVDSSTNNFNSTNPPNNNIDWSLIFYPTSLYSGLYSLLLLLFTVWVILGNSLVCIGTIKTYRQGQITTLYLCYVSSLDVFIGIFLLPIMSIVKLIGHFPYGVHACNLFVFWDYYIIIAAAFGHFGLIIMFFWEVKSPSTLPRSTGFHCKIIAGLWFGVLLVWLPSYFADLYKDDPNGAPAGSNLSPVTLACGFSNHNNLIGASYLGIFGLLIPYLIGSVLCCWSIQILWKREQTRKEIQEMLDEFKVRSRRMLEHARLNKFHVHHQANHSTGPTGAVKPFCIENSSSSSAETAPDVCHEAALVYAIFITFSLLRTPFYLYYFWGIFEPTNFPFDISLGIYWIMDINSVISCALHLSLTPAVRAGVKSFFCALPCGKSRKISEVVILSNPMNNLRKTAAKNEHNQNQRNYWNNNGNGNVQQQIQQKYSYLP